MEKKNIIQNCLYRGIELGKSSQQFTRKYSSAPCGRKFKLRIKKPDVQSKLWVHEKSVFETAMELYWSKNSR